MHPEKGWSDALPQTLGANASDRAEDELRDALRLLAAVGDTATGMPRGFSLGVGSLAGAFAGALDLTPDERAACYCAGLLHAVGSVRIWFDPEFEEVTERTVMLAGWDAPVHGARLCRDIAALPADTADFVRWHREMYDGTGFPDQLRWNAIPKGAAAVGLARAYRELCAGPEARSPEEAIYELMATSGRGFSAAIVRSFVEFFRTGREAFEGEFALAPGALAPGKSVASDVVTLIATAVDERDPETHGRSERLAKLACAIAERLACGSAEIHELERAARLFVLGALKRDPRGDTLDPLSRLARESRAKESSAVAQIATSGRSFADLAPILRSSTEWFDGSGLPDRLRGNQIPLSSRILAVCIASDALDLATPGKAQSQHHAPDERIAAVSGIQFDPLVVNAFLATRSAAS